LFYVYGRIDDMFGIQRISKYLPVKINVFLIAHDQNSTE
jgi:hypothetical protein